MITIKDKIDCCGCWGCYNTCPKHCITMVEDNEGFRYPHVNTELCIHCGLCEKVCPIINVKPEIKNPKQKACIVQNKDELILHESTSGGAFTAIAKWILDKGGVVFGAAYDNNFEVKHRYVEQYDDLRLFRNSKYVQSLIGDTYKQAKDFLRKGRYVCFSGTPCQLEGLMSYLRKPYDKLVTIDVVCRACPSPLVLRKYLQMQEKEKHIHLKDLKFRDKYHGYKYSAMSLYDADSKDYHQGIDTDFYLRSFFGGVNFRPSCSYCVFRKRYRNTDFTLWDCFDVDKFSKDLDNDKGVTRILIHTSKAASILNDITDSLKIEYIDSDKAVKGVKEMRESVTVNPKREAFFKDLNTMEAKDCFNKYFPITLRHRVEKQVRLWSNRLGIYKQMKKLFKILNGNREIKR